jgi:hypothetical protein
MVSGVEPCHAPLSFDLAQDDAVIFMLYLSARAMI